MKLFNETTIEEERAPVAPEAFDALGRRYQALRERRIKAEAERESSERRLADLKREAREKYGTDDVAKLQAMLEEMQAENERKRAEYQRHLDGIEERLAAVEAAHAESGGDDRP